MKAEVHAGGMLLATLLAAVASVGARLTTLRGFEGWWDGCWIAGFVVAWFLMSAAAVNFDMKRWLW